MESDLFAGYTKARVIDFETTGLQEDENAAVCEAGFTDVNLNDLTIGTTTDWLVDPGQPIPPQAMAVHHITDAEVAGCMKPYQSSAVLMRDMDPTAHVFAAHNAAYEQHFFGGGGVPWVCTYKCASVVWEDAPGFSNQVLRYWLGLPVDTVKSQPAHRAGPDTHVTAFLLVALLKFRTIEELIEISKKPRVEKYIGFGKHKGQQWNDLPSDYLSWIVKESQMDADAKYNGRRILDARKAAHNA